MTILRALAVLWLASPAIAADIPRYQVDTSWPKPLPHHWVLGEAAGIAVDGRDHIWVIQRPKSTFTGKKGAICRLAIRPSCEPAPPVLEFDRAGNLLRAWGGPGKGYVWPEREHGITIDYKGNVWLGGNGKHDGQYLKFTQDGRFLLQIGKSGQQTNSDDHSRLGQPASAAIDPQTNQVYIADGYFNHRVIVFDADTGVFLRSWGAYGKPPTDFKLPVPNPYSPQFANPVHCVKIANDGLVYVCDRSNNRIQVFLKDGTFVREIIPGGKPGPVGSPWDLAFWIDARQGFLFNADGIHNQMSILQSNSGAVLDRFGQAGAKPGEFFGLHNVAIDSNGDLYTTEVFPGDRVQKFRLLTPDSR
jgi:DNA-binding beta-propeller fold protein YncE